VTAPKKKVLSREAIHALRGKYKFDTGGKPFAEWMADWKRKEMGLEEMKFQRMMIMGRK
jgi:hypothetical protein